MVGSGGRWPEDGELDIMEHVGHRPARVFSTVHTQAGSGGHGKGAEFELRDACTAFHDYQMHWTREHIAFGVDGVEHFRYANPRQGPASWPFDAPQFLVLNIAIGGDLGGAVGRHDLSGADAGRACAGVAARHRALTRPGGARAHLPAGA